MEDLIRALNIKEIRYAYISYIDKHGIGRVLKLNDEYEDVEKLIVKEGEITE